MAFDYNAMKDKFKSTQEKTFTKNADERFWKASYDNKKPASKFIIRFLHDTDGNVYKDYFRHWFKYIAADGTEKVFDEFCPNVIGEKCGICASNSPLWDSGFPEDEKLARLRTRRRQYLTNIYIVKDFENPENDGSVKLWLFGTEIKKIYDGIMKEKEAVEKGVDGFEDSSTDNRTFLPFHPIEGANFMLRIDERQKVGDTVMITYEKSTFNKDNGPIDPSMNEKEAMKHFNDLIAKTHNLDQFMSEQTILTDSEITNRLPFVSGRKTSSKVEPATVPEPQKTAEAPPVTEAPPLPDAPPANMENTDNAENVDSMLSRLGLGD